MRNVVCGLGLVSSPAPLETLRLCSRKGPTPCVTFRLVVVSLRGPGRSPVLPLRMLRWVASFCRLLRPVLLLVSFPRSRSPVVGVLGLCWMWHSVPFARQRRPVVGALRLCWLLPGSFDCVCCPRASVHRPSSLCFRVRDPPPPRVPFAPPAPVAKNIAASSQVWGAGGGKLGVRKMFHFFGLHIWIPREILSILRSDAWSKNEISPPTIRFGAKLGPNVVRTF